ncbi:MAG: hypothetical protein LBR64_04945 [Dysgonamonadaceae bacterium]|jgi:hypothetical protein|nr:hypothetical protein [Dysgonamonadaceae bacterium]
MSLQNITFTPNSGLGSVLFTFTEAEIEAVMGKPVSRCGLHIYTEDLVLDGVQFSLLSQDEIRAYIKEYHRKYDLPFVSEESHNENCCEDKYYFHSIVLNIRFLDGKIDEICVWGAEE